jgi:hypothetical protein
LECQNPASVRKDHFPYGSTVLPFPFGISMRELGKSHGVRDFPKTANAFGACSNMDSTNPIALEEVGWPKELATRAVP